nr:9958_t:CDS:2 [Entrophospora candida]
MSQTSSAMSLCSEKLTLWILVKCSPRPTQFPVEWNTSPPNLDNLACKLCKEEKTFENIEPKFLEFFNHDDRINPLQADTLVTILNTTAAGHLVVCYPLSSSEGKFTQPDPEISDDIVNSFISELKRKKKTFIHINHNESTCGEFISAFMTATVEHAQLKESKLCLKSEEWLDGSHGFGPVDYSVHLEEFVLLVCEAKKEDFEKDKTDMEPEPQFDGDDMSDAKKITNYIASILQMQVSGLGSNKKNCLESQETAKSTEGSG